MIDTDKYEGHAKGPWYWDGNLCNDEHSDKHGIEQWAVLDWELGVDEVNARLIADAPLLLEEVKRLRESHPEFLKEQWADGYISAEELYEKLMTIRRFIDRTIEHALSWEEVYGGDEE